MTTTIYGHEFTHPPDMRLCEVGVRGIGIDTPVIPGAKFAKVRLADATDRAAIQAILNYIAKGECAK